MKQVEMNKNMKLSELNGLRLSPHFTLGELCKTNYKTADGNIPSRVVIENLRNLCENWLEDLRYSYNTLYRSVTSNGPFVTSSVVERSPEISPCASLTSSNSVATRDSQSELCSPLTAPSLSRDDKEGCRDDKPIIITSGYRSPEVNRLAGGSPTSNHLTGCAVDIHVAGFEEAIRYASILLDIAEGTKCDYDELYIERNKAGSYWIHFAVRPSHRSATQGDASLSKNRRKSGFLNV